MCPNLTAANPTHVHTPGGQLHNGSSSYATNRRILAHSKQIVPMGYKIVQLYYAPVRKFLFANVLVAITRADFAIIMARNNQSND